MSFITLVILSFAMSMDAFAVALAKGATFKNPTLWQTLKIALIFALIESITPIIGWAIGSFSKQWIEAWDHWIAFVLLTGIGLKVLFDVFTTSADEVENSTTPAPASFWLLCITALGTSIDAMTIGVSFAFLDINIWLAGMMIGCATLFMTFLGLNLGHRLNHRFGRYAEASGGIVLIVIACSILWQHLMV